ncbi:MAG: hypothetical protein JW807_08565 [Spirochaetes bacterium]|nr:hypothetical protein [Spirochaetota bacterium]
MNNSKRIIIAIIIIVLVAAGILLVESIRRGGSLYKVLRDGTETFSGECVPIVTGKASPAKFCAENAAPLVKKSFIDAEEKKHQEGWLLRDVLNLYVSTGELNPGTLVRVSSSSRGKKAELAWSAISDEANMVILAPTKQGTLKLASVMKGLDTRTLWVQDVDKIEIVRP